MGQPRLGSIARGAVGFYEDFGKEIPVIPNIK
jgi:hypothetical protein